MIITLIKKDRMFSFSLPEKASGQYWITDRDVNGDIHNLNSIEGMNGQWILKSNRKVSIISIGNELVKSVVLEELHIYNILIRNHNESAIIYAEPITENRQSYRKLMVKNGTDIYVGRSESNDISYNNSFVSSKHAKLGFNNNQWIIEDLRSSNGTYVNGYRVNKRVLVPGDTVYILGFKVICGGSFLAINNPDGGITFNKDILKPYIKQEVVLSDNNAETDADIKEQEQYFYISPRFKRDIEKKEIKIDPPPTQVKMDNVPLPLMLGPAITMGMASLFTGVLSVMNVMNNGGAIMNAAPTLVMSFSMLLGMIMWPILTKKYEKRQKEKNENIRQEKYLKYIDEIRDEIILESHHQAEILNENFVATTDCINRIDKRERSLWERVQGHNDFLKIRVGKGELPLEADIKYPERKFTLDDDNLRDKLYKLAETPKKVVDVPVTYSLEKVKVSGIIGKRVNALKFANGIITQIAALHSYAEVKTMFIFPENELYQWEFVKWLPHTWNNEKTMRYLACSTEDSKELFAFLEREISLRQEVKGSIKEFSPYFVIFFADKGLVDKTGIMQSVLRSGNDIGISIITMYDELKNLPKECSLVIELGDHDAEIYHKDDVSGKRIHFKPDIFMGSEVNKVATSLANIKLDLSSQSYTLPGMITFLEMFEVGKVEHLNALTRWKENNPTKTLQTPIGVNSAGGLFYLDLHEKFHGPHGLVAGMTGSGKSEFIITYILSMAVNYHPDEVSFILIDYKGGGLTGAFENEKARLPHLAGTITNLDGASIKRSLISIQSELRRRQTMFNDARKASNEGTMDIYKYQRLFRDGVVNEPLQHLFIISDEFAELKTQQPEFMEQLISAARIGRSLGIHLILATQKPSGVVDDQIWSNSRFRVCLKVQEKSDSMDMIKRSDAAELSATGRFYLQVGFNELFDLGQSAWCGAPYNPSDSVEKKKDNSVNVIDNFGRIIKTVKPIDKKEFRESNRKQNTEILQYLSNLAAEENIKIKQLWLEAIPAIIYIDDLKRKYSYYSHPFELDPVIGEYDDPYNQRQDLLTLSLSKEGNAIIYGATGSGKTTFLSTMMTELLREHTSDELNIYAIDMGSETLKNFENAPQVGDIILSGDSEKVMNLFRMLRKEIEDRKKLFANYGGNYSSYCKFASKPVPNIVIIINNYATFIETYDNYEDTVSFLSREGVKLGLYFLLTANSANAIRYRILQNFKQLLTLQLNDPSEYVSIIGNTDGVLPSKIKGRGIVKLDYVYEFQVAHVVRNENEMTEYIKKLCEESVIKSKGIYANPVPTLPKHIDLSYFEGKTGDLKKVPLGIDKQTLNPVTADVASSFITLVLSQDEEVSYFMQGLSEVIATNVDINVKVLDASSDFENDGNKKYDYINSSMEEHIVTMFYLLAERNNKYKDYNSNLPLDEEFPRVVYIINSLSNLLLNISDDAKDKLKVLLEKGEAKYNVSFIISCQSTRLAAMTHEIWYRKHCAEGNGIWIGDGILERTQLKINKISNELYQEVKCGFGYVVRKGKYKVVKLLTTYLNNGGEYDE